MEKTDCNHDDGVFLPPTDTFDPTTPFFDSFLSSSHASCDRNTQRDRKKGNPLLLLLVYACQCDSSEQQFLLIRVSQSYSYTDVVVFPLSPHDRTFGPTVSLHAAAIL